MMGVSLENAKRELKTLFDKEGLEEGQYLEFADTHLSHLIDSGSWSQEAFSDAKKYQSYLSRMREKPVIGFVGEIDQIMQKHALKFADKCKESLGDMSDDEIESYEKDAAALAYFEVLCDGGCPVTPEHRELYKLAIHMGTVYSLDSKYTEESEEVKRFIEIAHDVGMDDESAISALKSFGVNFTTDTYSEFAMRNKFKKAKAEDAVFNDSSAGSFSRKE